MYPVVPAWWILCYIRFGAIKTSSLAAHPPVGGTMFEYRFQEWIRSLYLYHTAFFSVSRAT